VRPDPERLPEDVDGVPLRRVLEAINERLEWLLDRDHLIGHAWLMGAKTRRDVDSAMRGKISSRCSPSTSTKTGARWRQCSATG